MVNNQANEKTDKKTDKKTDEKTDEKEYYVGAVIEINQKRINLIPSTPVNKIKDRGLKLALDKPLELGKFGKAMDSICKDIGIKENPLSEQKINEIDSPLLKNAAKKVVNANMRIEALQYEQPPAEKKEPTKYVFVASVNWTDDNNDNDGKDGDFFKLKGLIFGVSSGFTDNKTGENPEVQKAFLSALQVMAPASSQAALPQASDGESANQNSAD